MARFNDSHDGIDGVPGPTGPKGDKGDTGAKGDTGNSGVAASEVTFSVVGGSTGNQPQFNGAPLFEGSYIKNGALVNFRLNVLMTNITQFGSGQYYMDLPFTAKYGTLFRNGCLHRASNGKQYGIAGHVAAGASRMYLFYTASTGQDDQFTQSSPVVLSQADSFHISGSYIFN